MRRGLICSALAVTVAMGASTPAWSQTVTAPPPGQPETSVPITGGDRSSDGAALKEVPTIATTYPAAGAGLGPRTGYYYVSRWAEDWSFLRDRPKDAKGDPFDPLKYIPIAADGEVYLSLSDEERARLNYTTNPGLKQRQNPDQELLRSVVGADLHLGDHFRIYGELGSDQQWGANKSFGSTSTVVSPVYRNDVLVQQLFGEVRGNLAGATMGAMVGRQEFQDGPPVFIGLRPASNVYTVENGVRLYANWSFMRVDLFSFRSTNYNLYGFDDGILDSERIKGIATSFAVPRTKTPLGETSLFFDPFYYRYRDDDKKWGPTTGLEERNIYGARLWGTVGNLTLDVTEVREDGSYINRAISAYGSFALAEYQLSDSGLRPRIGFHTDYGSGGGAYGTGTLHDFNYLTGSTPYISWGFFVAPENLQTFAPFARINPTPKLRLTAEVEMLRRPDQYDAVYMYTGPYAGTQLVRGHDIGTLDRSDAAWSISRHWSANLYFEYLHRGAVLEEAGLNSSTYFGGALTFKF
jgi:hypothetical protein